MRSDSVFIVSDCCAWTGKKTVQRRNAQPSETTHDFQILCMRSNQLEGETPHFSPSTQDLTKKIDESCHQLTQRPRRWRRRRWRAGSRVGTALWSVRGKSDRWNGECQQRN